MKNLKNKKHELKINSALSQVELSFTVSPLKTQTTALSPNDYFQFDTNTNTNTNTNTSIYGKHHHKPKFSGKMFYNPKSMLKIDINKFINNNKNKTNNHTSKVLTINTTVETATNNKHYKNSKQYKNTSSRSHSKHAKTSIKGKFDIDKINIQEQIDLNDLNIKGNALSMHKVMEIIKLKENLKFNRKSDLNSNKKSSVPSGKFKINDNTVSESKNEKKEIVLPTLEELKKLENHSINLKYEIHEYASTIPSISNINKNDPNFIIENSSREEIASDNPFKDYIIKQTSKSLQKFSKVNMQNNNNFTDSKNNNDYILHSGDSNDINNVEKEVEREIENEIKRRSKLFDTKRINRLIKSSIRVSKIKDNTKEKNSININNTKRSAQSNFTKRSVYSTQSNRPKKTKKSKLNKQINKEQYFSDDSQYFDYDLDDLNINFYPQSILNIIKHQKNQFEETFRNKDEYYAYINSCEEFCKDKKIVKLQGIFTQTEIKKIYKINCKDRKKAMKIKNQTVKDKVLKIFRNGIESTDLKPDPFLQRKQFFLAKNPLPIIRSIRGKKEPVKGKINYLNEIFDKTTNWIKKQYDPISSKINKINKQHIFSLSRENGVRFGEDFQIADREKFDDPFRSCHNVEVEDKSVQIRNLLNKIASKNQNLKNEVFKEDIDVKANVKIDETDIKTKKWIRCIISASIQFKRMNCSINEFYSDNFVINKPYSKEGSWHFFQAVKNGAEDVVLNLLAGNKFLTHDFDFHNQIALHWAAKRNFPKLITILANFGSKIDHQDSSGRTPLHYAVQNAHFECVILLLKEMANPLISDALGKTPSQLCDNENILFYLKRVKALYIIYKNHSHKDANTKIKAGIDYVFAHETRRIFLEKEAIKKRKLELGY